MNGRAVLRTGILLLLISALPVWAEEPSPEASPTVSFRQHVAPILLEHCIACHGAKKAEGGYRVDTYEQAMSEGDSASAGFLAGDVESSEAFRRITSEDESERMPLEGEPLPDEQVALLRTWIEQGAAYDAEDPKAPLASIVPPPTYPPAPENYPHPLPITALAFNPAGDQLVASGYHELTIWNPESGSLLRRIGNVGQRTYAIDISPDGQLIAVAGGTPGRLGEVRVVQADSGEVRQVLGTTTDVVLDVAFSPQGDRLLCGAADGVIRVFEVSSGEEQRTINSHSDWVMAVAWNKDATKIASASRDKTSKVFDAATGELLVTYSGHNEAVRGVAFHPGGEEVYSSGGDKKIHRWKIADGNRTAEVGFGGEVFQLELAGEFLLAPSAEKSVRQLNADNQQQVRSYGDLPDWVLSTAFHQGTKRLAAGCFNGQIRVWNAESGEAITSFTAAPGQ